MQRKEDFSILESRLRVELERQYYELKAKYNQDVRNIGNFRVNNFLMFSMF